MNEILRRVVTKYDLKVLQDYGEGVTVRTTGASIEAVSEVIRDADLCGKNCRVIATDSCITMCLEPRR